MTTVLSGEPLRKRLVELADLALTQNLTLLGEIQSRQQDAEASLARIEQSLAAVQAGRAATEELLASLRERAAWLEADITYTRETLARLQQPGAVVPGTQIEQS